MPLSKTKNRDRMRKARLHAKVRTLLVQPKKADVAVASHEIDADGNIIPAYH